MLAIGGILLLFVSWGVFQWTLRRGSYRRYPYEQFVLVGASVLIGLTTVLVRASVVHVVLFAIELAAFAGLVWYMSAGARFSRGAISLSVGDRFPSFELIDSHGRPFDSECLRGQTALILFYRGPW
jgi:cytochrome oxidase Cu insertion factor (SCO1/SenC/PrrC family)